MDSSVWLLSPRCPMLKVPHPPPSPYSQLWRWGLIGFSQSEHGLFLQAVIGSGQTPDLRRTHQMGGRTTSQQQATRMCGPPSVVLYRERIPPILVRAEQKNGKNSEALLISWNQLALESALLLDNTGYTK